MDLIIWILCIFSGIGGLTIIGASVFATYDALLTKKLRKQMDEGIFIEGIEKIIKSGTVIKSDDTKKMEFKLKKMPFTILTDGKKVWAESRTTETLFSIEKEDKKYHLQWNTDRLKLFMPYFEKLHDQVIERYNEEFHKDTSYLTAILHGFKRAFHVNIPEHRKKTLHDGAYRFEYTKTSGEYAFRLLMNERLVWYARYNEQAQLSKDSEDFKTKDLNEEEVTYLQEKIEAFKTIIEQKLKNERPLVERELDAVYQMIKKNEQTDDETKQKLDTIFQLYHALSSEMKQEKEKEILSLVENLKTEMKQEKIYLVD